MSSAITQKIGPSIIPPPAGNQADPGRDSLERRAFVGPHNIIVPPCSSAGAIFRDVRPFVHFSGEDCAAEGRGTLRNPVQDRAITAKDKRP